MQKKHRRKGRKNALLRCLLSISYLRRDLSGECEVCMETGHFKKLIFVIIISIAFNFIPCPNVFSFTDILPASGTTVDAGGQMSVTSVSASTGVSVGATNAAPSISYGINASGNGFIEAAMAAQVQQGFGLADWVPMPAFAAPVFAFDAAGPTQTQIGAAGPDSANYHFPALDGFIEASMAAQAQRGFSFERFEQVSSASGAWTFSKEMSYSSGTP